MHRVEKRRADIAHIKDHHAQRIGRTFVVPSHLDVGRLDKSLTSADDHRRPTLKIERELAFQHDVAFRSGDTQDNLLIGRKIADSLWAVYGGRDYLAQHGQPRHIGELARHAWVGFDETMANHRATLWLRQVAPGARLVATSASVLGTLHFAKANLGLAALPTALGDAESDLVRVLGPITELTRSWRMLTTRQLRRTPRVAAFFAFVASEAQAMRKILTG